MRRGAARRCAARFTHGPSALDALQCQQSGHFTHRPDRLPGDGRGHGPGLLRNIRAGQHTWYDRLVFDLADGAAGYQARYVPGVTADGTGDPVPLRGGAFLQIIFYVLLSDQSEIGYIPANRSEVVDVSGWRTCRQVADAGHFEGQVTIGLGVRARLPFRVFTLDGPGDTSRLVVDVAHRW